MKSAQVITSVHISEVWRHLGGGSLRPVGLGRYRGRAWWRGGDGWPVALDDRRGVWYDHRDAIGGGVLDLVVHVRGGDRQDALHWLAAEVGISLDHAPRAPKDLAASARRRRALERDLPSALRWRRTAVLLAEEALADLKTELYDLGVGPTDVDSVATTEAFLSRVRRLDGVALAKEYCDWRVRYPALTAGMVRAAKMRELAERSALQRYLET